MHFKQWGICRCLQVWIRKPSRPCMQQRPPPWYKDILYSALPAVTGMGRHARCARHPARQPALLPAATQPPNSYSSALPSSAQHTSPSPTAVPRHWRPAWRCQAEGTCSALLLRHQSAAADAGPHGLECTHRHGRYLPVTIPHCYNPFQRCYIPILATPVIRVRNWGTRALQLEPLTWPVWAIALLCSPNSHLACAVDTYYQYASSAVQARGSDAYRASAQA